MSDTIETQLQKTYNEIFEMKDELLQKEMADLKEKIEHNRASLELVHNQLQTNIYPILFGSVLKYHICATGTTNSICPIRSLLTFFSVTSTPHLSQIIPLYLILLYLPQWHSQSFTGPKILSQKSPPISGLNVL